MQVYRSTLRLPGAASPAENPLPMFRDRAHDKRFVSDGTLSPAELEGLGRHTGFRVLPYCMQDGYDRVRTPRAYESVVLENECLRAEFLPQYGGRLYSLFDKERGRDLLFQNPVFQCANLAIRDAWFSGGVEWNVAQTGHSYTTCDDVYFACMEEPGGGNFLRLYDYVRTTGIFWQVDFYLPSGSRALYAHVTVLNDGADPVPLYWWTNTAVPEERNVRVFSGTGEVLYINPNSLRKEGDDHAYGHARLPCLPSMPGVDATYPLNSAYTNEFFFQNGSADPYPWEAAAYDDGFAFVERSTQPLCTRKMFCWGAHAGGRNWLDHLSEPGKGAYVEIQAGLAPTQVHGRELPGGELICFTQAFGSMEVDPAASHAPDWDAARQAVQRQAEQALPAGELERLHRQFQSSAALPCGELLHLGHGWGYVEGVRRSQEGRRGLPGSLCFPREAAGEEELRWLSLLTDGAMPDLDGGTLPRSWMTDPGWEAPLRAAVERAPDNRTLRVSLGVLLYENGRTEEAVEQWEAALRAGPSAIAHRNLAVACERDGRAEEALAHLEQAYALCPGKEIAREYLALLNRTGNEQKAWAVYTGASPEVAEDERVMITAAAAALAVGADGFLERALRYPFAVIREGENQMVDLWFRYQARRRAAAEGRSDLDQVERALRRTAVPPRNIDFRLTQG